MRKLFFIYALTFICALGLSAKTNSFAFLTLPYSSQAAALGGKNVSYRSGDLNFSMQNPALLTNEMHKSLALNVTSYLADINFGSVIYCHNIDTMNFLSYGVQFINYGKFTERNERDEEMGSFSANDWAMYVSYGRRLSERWTAGATLKPVFSSYESYFSFALAVDLGVSYYNKEKDFSFGFAMRNIGRQLKGYYKEDNAQHIERLPFDISLGITQKLAHAPFRYSITLHNLQKWDNYADYAKKGENENTIEKNAITFGDNLLRHFILGIEFVPSDKFFIAIGYNHQRRRELKVFENKSLNGFSAGLGLKVSKFNIGFSVAKYHVMNMSYNFSLSTNFNAFRKL